MQLKNIRFDNPMFSLTTTFNRDDFTRLLIEQFHVPAEPVAGVLRHGPRHELLRRPVDHGRPVVRAVLPRPRRRGPAADGADHLCQRLDAGRPGHHLRHRVLELHVERRVHLPGRHRSADRPDARRDAARTASTCASAAMSRRSTSAAAAWRPSRSTAGRSRPRPSFPTPTCKATIFSLVGEEHFDRDVRRRGPGRAAEQLQHAGLHGAEAGRSDRREPAATCCSVPRRRCSAPSLLLSRDITSRTYSFYYPRTRPGSEPVADRLQHQRQLRRLGRPVGRRIRGQQAGPDRNHARRHRKVRARHPRQARTCRSRHAA